MNAMRIILFIIFGAIVGSMAKTNDWRLWTVFLLIIATNLLSEQIGSKE